MKEEAEFKSKKIFALIVIAGTGLWALYSYFFTQPTPALTKQVLVISSTPVIQSQKYKGNTSYWLEFDTFNHHDTIFKLVEDADYKAIINDVRLFDSLEVLVDEDRRIYSLSLRGVDYVDSKKLFESNNSSWKLFLYGRIAFCFACLPIFFFKRQPLIHYSGFEYKVNFTLLALGIQAIFICVYLYFTTIYLHGLYPNR